MNPLPFVSIIMAIRNEANFIARSLDALLAQDYPRDRMEIIVVDGVSEDETREVVSKCQMGNPKFEIRLLDNPDRIASSGLNAAIQEARGEIIVRVDGHAEIPPDYVGQCVEWLGRTAADCVGGAVNSVGVSYLGEAIATAVSSLFGMGGPAFRTVDENAKPTLTDTVPFGAFRRAVFERIGLFNTQMVRHQDYELNYRLRRAGGEIMLLPSARVTYYVRSTLSSLWRQYWQYGFWKGRFLRLHPRSLRIRHMIPPLFFLAVAISSILAVVSPWGLRVLEFTLSTYGVFMITALIWLSRNGKSRYASLFPAVLACLHASWGLGVWFGVLAPKLSLSVSERQET
ncbi:MAG: glycosyltransferase [Proteobacteria bacterium]|nr:glycosyltransferase [Pseudomonadota bacterium]